MSHFEVNPDHRWFPDTHLGWRRCTCLNRCGWVRRVISTSPDVHAYYLGELVTDDPPACLVLVEDL